MIKDEIYHRTITDLTELEILYGQQLAKKPGDARLKETMLKLSCATSVMMGTYYSANRYLEAARERDHTIYRMVHEIYGLEMKISMLEEVNQQLSNRIEEITKQHEV